MLWSPAYRVESLIALPIYCKLNDLASAIENNVAAALAEDIGSGDWTAQLIAAGANATASVVCRSAAVLCGRAVV